MLSQKVDRKMGRAILISDIDRLIIITQNQKDIILPTQIKLLSTY